MAWTVHPIVLRLRGPLHVGWSKLGNVQYARPYVTGRAIWGALANRLARDAAQGKGSVAESPMYISQGDSINKRLAFTYFYPAVLEDKAYVITWPWERAKAAALMGSYTSTAIEYRQMVALVGSLHESEMLAPRRPADGKPVFLVGYIFEKSHEPILPWHATLSRLQFGADRSYGWGWVEPVLDAKLPTDTLFDGRAVFEEVDGKPAIRLTGDDPRLLAHTNLTGLDAAGVLEPVVGRELRSDDGTWTFAGQYVTYDDSCYAPGSSVRSPMRFTIGKFGIWHPAP